MRMTKRRWSVAATVALVVAAATWMLLPEPLEIDMATVTRGPLEVSISEDGIARIRERYEVAAPVGGELLRVEVHPGDAVTAGAVLARIQPAPLDPKQRAQLAGRLESAERASSEARALLRRAHDAARRARSEAERIRKLAESAIVSRDALEAALTAQSIAIREEEAASFRAEATAYEVTVARAALGELEGSTEVVVRSPVSGRVLQVPRESERVVLAGTPLVTVGDPASLEIVADFLSTDAVQIASGAEARIERWGGTQPLPARVRTVEPSAFTRVSALGVEEQRVNVVCDLTAAGGTLGDQYRVDVRVVLWRGLATKAPATAFFMADGQWQVFAVRDGRAHLQRVRAGRIGDTEIEIAGGLEPGDTIVVHPSDQIRDGVRVKPRG